MQIEIQREGGREEMAMISINGINLPDPSSLKMSKVDISTAKSGRDERGRMHKMVVARKRKYEVSWKQLDPDDAYLIESMCESGAELTITIYDPSSGGEYTGVYTCGDRDADWQQWIPDEMRNYDTKLFKTVSVNFIEV